MLNFHKAHSVILAHNHLGGSPSPSPHDIEVTKRIQVALAQISISVLDHITVAGEQYTSCAERGLFWAKIDCEFERLLKYWLSS